MKHLTFNSKTIKTLAKVSTGYSTQKVLGALHLTAQTGADLLQSTANTIAKYEASVLTELNIYNESFNELIKIRTDRTRHYQQTIKQTPSKIITASNGLKNKFKDFMIKRKLKTSNS
jgi:small-conductance mechanosensitive channel